MEVTVKIIEYSVTMFDVWSRMSEVEAEKFMKAKLDAGARLQGQIDASHSFISSGEFFTKLYAMIADVTSDKRACEILGYKA